MEQGRLVQNDTPLNIYHNPATPFVAEFLNLEELIWSEDGGLMKRII